MGFDIRDNGLGRLIARFFDTSFDPENPESLTLASIRRKVLQRMLFTCVVFGGIIFTITAALDFARGNYLTGFTYLLFFAMLIASLLARSIPYAIRCTFVLLVIYTIGTYEIVNWGIATIGPVLYLTVVVFASILLGTRVAIASVLITLTSLVALALYHWSQLPPGDDATPWHFIQSGWLPDILNLTMVSTMVTAFMELLLRGLQQSISSTEQHVETLKEERNQLNETIKERDAAESQLVRAQKMEAVGQLAGGVAHDFNNLLQVVLGYGETALEEIEHGTELHEQLELITQAGERGKKLVSQLLAFSRRQVLELMDVDLNEIITDLEKIVTLLLGENITMEMKLDDAIHVVRADRGQIEQVLVNLCVNARDAMPTGGTLTIETVPTSSDAQIPKTAIIKITDTGSGMNESTRDQMFEPFFSTKTPEDGTGLGLSTVFGIVHQHNGTVTCESALGKGTTFTIALPALDTPATRIESSEKTDNGAAPAPAEKTILLADDEPMVLRISKTMLEGAGYTVLTATDGLEAIELLDQHGPKIDMAVLDVVMPRLGGKEVADHIRKTGSGIPVLYASGYGSDTVQSHFVPNHEIHFIQKPFRRDELLQKVAEVI